MSTFHNLTPDTPYETLLAAVANGHDVPQSWLIHSRRAEERQAEERQAEEVLAADLEAAHTANTARIKAREDKARKDVPPLLAEYEAAKAAASAEYAAARKAVAKANQAFREAHERYNTVRSYIRELVGRDELPRDQDGNVTGVTAYIHTFSGNVFFEGEQVAPPQPFKA